MSPYSRRDVLRAGLGAVGLSFAGCLSAPRGDGERIRTTTVEPTTTARPPSVLRMERVPPAKVTADATVALFSPAVRTWLDRAVESGAVDLPDGVDAKFSLERADFVRYGGHTYRLSTARVDVESSHELTMSPATGTVGPEADVVSFEELGAKRQKTVRDARRGEARVGFHEEYEGQYEFAKDYDYVEYEGEYYSLKLLEDERTDEHTVLRTEPVQTTAIGPEESVLDVAYVELPDEDRRAVATAMRSGSATASEFSTPLKEAVESMDYVAGPSAIYTATVEKPE